MLPIEQTKVTQQQAKVQKIIAETDARAEKIIFNAENKSNTIIQDANLEAERIINEAREKAQQEYEAIKQQAYQEGFNEGHKAGYEKFQNDALEGLKSLEVLAKSSFDIKNNIIESATTDIIELVAEIADKVCHEKFDENILKKITLDAINLLNNKEEIVIIVNPLLVEKISNLIPIFKQEILKLDNVKIIEDSSLSSDGVIVQTLDTRLDSRISSQISEISRLMLTGRENELEQE